MSSESPVAQKPGRDVQGVESGEEGGQVASAKDFACRLFGSLWLRHDHEVIVVG